MLLVVELELRGQLLDVISLGTTEYDEFLTKITDALLEALSEHQVEAITAFEYDDEDGCATQLRGASDYECMIEMLRDTRGTGPWQLSIRPVCLRLEDGACSSGGGVAAAARRLSLATSTSSTSSVFTRGLNPSGVRVEALQNQAVLGTGHCGTVYKTLDTARGQLMATKCITIELIEEQQNQIIREMQILQKCSSPYIIEFYAGLFAGNSFLICFEYMDGGSLDRYGQLPRPVLQPTAVAVLLGLLYLWNMKIMHRDIKPSNILLNSGGQVKLCDFGVSRQLQSSLAETYVGTKAYMAPERINGGSYQIYSDVWSYGLTILELAIGRFPFAQENDCETECVNVNVLQRIATQPVPDCSEQLVGYDAPFTEFVAHCIERDVSARPTAAQLQQHAFVRLNTPVQHEAIADHVKLHRLID